MPSIEPAALLAQIEAGVAPTVLDVRTRAEFVRGHVPRAISAPFQTLTTLPRALSTRPHAPVVLYCGHGPRAHIAAALLRRLGVREVTLLRGHMSGWRRAGLPEERGPASSRA